MEARRRKLVGASGFSLPPLWTPYHWFRCLSFGQGCGLGPATGQKGGTKRGQSAFSSLIFRDIIAILNGAQAFPAFNKARGLHAHYRSPVISNPCSGGQASHDITFCFQAHGKSIYFFCDPDQKKQRFFHRVRRGEQFCDAGSRGTTEPPKLSRPRPNRRTSKFLRSYSGR